MERSGGRRREEVIAGAAPWRASDASVRAICEGRHGDPFAVLGPHHAKGGTVVRVFAPHAGQISVEVNGAEHPLERRSWDGFFEGLVKGANPADPYILTARNEDGHAWSFDDPYRFAASLGSTDDYLLVEGSHRRLYERLGAHPVYHQHTGGVRFSVWAPHAQVVSLVGEFNAWDGRRHPMRKRVDSGVWELFMPGLTEGVTYKFEIRGPAGDLVPLKADPFGFAGELRPSTASRVARTDNLPWGDDAYMAARAPMNYRRAPVTIYEVHLGSWRRGLDGAFLSYDDFADQLVAYAVDMGFTHLELMPVNEHPLDDSWGYQPVGLFAPTSRFGDPAGFARLVDRAHRAGLGVLLDWTPAHFPMDSHGLAKFDGEALYEHPDPRRGYHPQWTTAIYDYGRREVSNFLHANALYWLNRFHIDGLRVDAVASMLYLDYAREDGEWLPNDKGGNENLEAVAFMQELNRLTYEQAPGSMMVAEESTAWPGVSAPTYTGGLGFGFKWNMGWMNDTLRYMAREPIHRKYHHNEMNFGLLYAFSENFVLPLSHDEVVHGKGSLIGKMPGDDWQKFAGLRAYFGFMWGHPGKKLLFQGGEFAQRAEWNFRQSLDWHLLDYAPHQGVQKTVRDLNRLYRTTGALHARDCEAEGFRWIVADDAGNSVLAWLRFGEYGDSPVAVISNFTPVPRPGYRIGLPMGGEWIEVFNSDSADYGGSGMGNLGHVIANHEPAHGFSHSADITLPPMATIMLRQGG